MNFDIHLSIFQFGSAQICLQTITSSYIIYTLLEIAFRRSLSWRLGGRTLAPPLTYPVPSLVSPPPEAPTSGAWLDPGTTAVGVKTGGSRVGGPELYI